MRKISLILAICLVPAFVHASTVVALSEEELVSRSDIIVMGTVVHTSVKVKNGSEIVTHAVLQVYQRLLGGEATRFITIEVPGGILPNGLRSVTSGAPKLVLGDMVLGYLERHGDVFWPLGLSYGLLRVWLNAEGKATVVRQLDGLYLLRPEPISGSVNLLRTPEPLNVYIQRIAHLVGQPALPWGGEVQKW